MSAVAQPIAVTVRQAVCDRARAVVGYEILSFDGAAGGGARDTARALLEAFSGDLDLIAGRLPAYVSVAPELLRGIDVLPVAPDRVVLQVDAAAAGDDELLAGLRRLASLGYTLAARDPRTAAAVRLPRVFGLARVNVAGRSPGDAAAVVRALATGADVEVHALGVADVATFEACAAAGALAFQGPFRELPRLAGGARAEVGPLSSAVELLGGDHDFDALEALVSRDLGLAYKLLRYANSAFFMQRREIGTVREAMAMLGERMTRRWASMATLAMSGVRRPDGLLGDALLRARVLEELAGDLPGLDRDRAFTVGLFSLLDALVDRPMADAVDGLGLPADVTGALLRREPPYGPLLERVLLHLRGEADGPGVERVDAAYRAALVWLGPVLAELDAG